MEFILLFFLAFLVALGILIWIIVSSEGLSGGTFRRLYFFLIAFAALNVAAAGAVNLLTTLLRPVVEPAAVLGDARFFRDQVAFGAAQVIVALPIWVGHWLATQRAATRDTEEARSLLRVFFLYGIMAAAGLFGLFQSVFLLRSVLSYPVGLGSPATLLAITRSLGWLAIYGVIWAYHRPIAVALDLTPRGRTIWRWYVYVLAGFGLGTLIHGVYWLLHEEINYVLSVNQTLLLGSHQAVLARNMVSYAPYALVGGLWWMLFWRRSAGADAKGRLRQLYIFLTLAIALAANLIGVSWMLYEGLRFLLGYRSPNGIEQARFLADAVPLFVLGGLGWLYHHAVIEAEAPSEQSMATPPGRVYFYLITAAGLLLASVGLANLLSTLLDFLLQVFREIGDPADWWRDRISLGIVMALVGLPVWLVHWRLVQHRVSGHAKERQTLPRRVYVYGLLLVGVLSLLVFLGMALNDILRIVLGETVNRKLLSDILKAMGYAAIAGVVVAYHWQVTRTDGAATGTAEPRPAPKRVLLLAGLQQRSSAQELEGALGARVELLELVGAASGPALSAEAMQELAERVRRAPSESVLVILGPNGDPAVYAFRS